MNNSKLITGALNLFESAEGFVVANGPSILTGVGIGGMITTVVMACKETPKAVELLKEKDLKKPETPKEKFEYGLDVLKTTGPIYWPAMAVGLGTIACFVCANHIHLKRATALGAAYFVADGRLKELDDKAKEVLGEKKYKKVKDEIAAERVANTPLNMDEVIKTGFGNTLCFDAFHGRYFYSDPEKIRRVELEFEKERIDEWNHQHRMPEAGVSEMLGLPVARISAHLWFTQDAPLEFEFTSTLKDDIPVLVVDYANDPEPDYRFFNTLQD